MIGRHPFHAVGEKYIRAVVEARRPETRARRLDAVVAKIRSGLVG